MHTLTLSAFSWERAALGASRSTLTIIDTTGCDWLCITDGTHTATVGGVTSKRLPIRDLTRTDLVMLRLGAHHMAVFRFLERMGHTVDLDTMVTLVRWTHWMATSTPLAATFQTQELMEVECVRLEHPNIQLTTMLASVGCATNGQAVAIGLRYQTGTTTYLSEILDASAIRILVRTNNGFSVVPLESYTDPSVGFVANVEQWLRYGYAINDWNLVVGERAATHLSAFCPNSTHDADVFFFVDRAVAVADLPDRVMVMALPQDPLPMSSHAALAHVLRFPQALATLHEAPMEE